MPHDKHGTPLSVGDLVIAEFMVTAVQPGEEYCNVTLETVEPMFPGTHKLGITLNAKQVILAAHAS